MSTCQMTHVPDSGIPRPKRRIQPQRTLALLHSLLSLLRPLRVEGKLIAPWNSRGFWSGVFPLCPTGENHSFDVPGLTKCRSKGGRCRRARRRRLSYDPSTTVLSSGSYIFIWDPVATALRIAIACGTFYRTHYADTANSPVTCLSTSFSNYSREIFTSNFTMFRRHTIVSQL